MGNGPHGFRISKDSKFAYVANMGEDTVSVVDIENKKEIRKITVGKTPITPDNKYVYVTNMYDGTVSVVDNSTDKVVKTTKVENDPNGITYR